MPGPLPAFYEREVSDRFVPGTKPVWIRNATIWTGRVQGLETVYGDVLLSGGIIKALGTVSPDMLAMYNDVEELDAHGSWVSPGIVDVHSHVGVESAPALDGAADGNSLKGTIQAWLRSIDGLNTHDESYALAVAGGVTTSLILPGSANAIGGQAYTIKLRPTSERSPTAMLLEPPVYINGTNSEYVGWQHMKHACGENPSRVYGATRLDSVWAWREVYNTARILKAKQDDYCLKAKAGKWDNLGDFPADLQHQPLVDILRGKTKVQTHCYEAVDLDNFVRLTNEFKFPVAAFHHAHETYLVPDVLKRAYGSTPAVAIFSEFQGYKREAYHSTHFAAKILDEAGIRVTMKSDHAAIISRYLLHEAQQAHHFGLEAHRALSSVTATAANVIGLDHRIGYLKVGYDADVVLWDSHPLALGATPTQVFIDGIAQLASPVSRPKPASAQVVPETPDYDVEAAETLVRQGEPTLEGITRVTDRVVFLNVSAVYVRGKTGIEQIRSVSAASESPSCVVVEGGIITDDGCEAASDAGVVLVDLKGGEISPALVAPATSIGLQEIAMEESTTDGQIPDPLVDTIPSILKNTLARAVDGLQFASRDAILSYRAGVTTAVTAPATFGFGELGLSASFSLGAPHVLAPGALIQSDSALHITLARPSSPSISTRIGALRRLLLDNELQRQKGAMGEAFGRVAIGILPLVVRVDSADIIASLISVKREVEEHTGARIKLVLVGAMEAHLLAEELASENVGVLVQARPFPYAWDSKRILPGPPLSEKGQVQHLLDAGVRVGLIPLGISDSTPGMSGWAARNLRWDAGWIALENNLTHSEALSLVSSTVDSLLGVRARPSDADLVATRSGGLLEFEGKVVGIVSPRVGGVDLFGDV
ncbi:carbohydrate esterase family 9 protein [Peniophora sp. CONT]|nr:carbohydrate esterase family 9 protein [Peniophora sp. CONT]